jgi:hypothetical protein
VTGSRTAVRLVAGAAALSILGWAVPALLMLDRGFTIQDEGTYVLSYRWWDTNPYFSLGSQYFYGPVFEALDEDIPALRLLRLVMVVAANAWFGWVFLRWLAHHRGLTPSRGARVSGTLLLVASGGLTYLWSPLTPGYYDLVTDLGLALAALFFSLLVRLPRVPWWVPLISGVLSFALVVTKWPALLVVLVSQGAALVVVLGLSRRQALRYAGLLVAGVAVAAVLTQVFVFRLSEVLPIIRETSRLAASGGHGPADLLQTYASTSLQFGLAALLFAVPAVAAYLVAVRSTTLSVTAARGLVVGGLVVTGIGIPLAAGWHGGDGKGRVVVAVILASLLTAIVAATLPRVRGGGPVGERRVTVAALVVLTAMPLGQAVGSDVPWIYLAGTCLAMWVAAIAVVATAAPRPGLAGFAVLGSLVAVALEVAMIAGTTTLITPFHTSGLRGDTATVDGLRGLKVPAEDAREYDALRTALTPYLRRDRTPMFTVGRIAGLTYILGGVPIGPTWTDASHPDVLADTLSFACRNGDAPSRPPVLLLDRPVDRGLIEAMRGCGFDFPAAYRSLPVHGGPPGVRAFVPRPAAS